MCSTVRVSCFISSLCCTRKHGGASKKDIENAQQELTLALIKTLPDLLRRYQTDALKVKLISISTYSTGFSGYQNPFQPLYQHKNIIAKLALFTPAVSLLFCCNVSAKE